MVTASNPSFDACRVNANNALQMMKHSQQWREQLLKLEQHRLERDRAALEGALETLSHAQDWSDLAAASQSVLRDYLSESAAIWQEGVAAAMQGAGAWTDTARDIAQNWQDSLPGLQPGAATASALPMREWMAAFERAVSGATPNGTAGARNGAGKHAAHAQGGQHDR
ncbi:hypothetical protein [Paraburkholderia adhaesiva]|uniref:hypothetical protein n=1 Tax=Paraburkholderia adhaesiva TaxID=2883244 RepID=UPI001F45070D|nr:hypothetical protein [Paraburkholderia adhaesiva]